MDSAEGMIVGLHGPWGSGKTTLLNFVLEFVGAAGNAPIVVHFNPWWFSGLDNLLGQFFAQLSAAVRGAGDATGRFHRLALRVRRSLSRDRVGKGLDIAGSFVGNAEAAAPLAKLAGRIFKLGAALLSPGSVSVHAAREDIIRLLRGSKQRVLIVVDDIDRLSPEEVRQLFGVMKAVADFPRVLYLIAFDRDIVVRHLGHSYAEGAQDYLSKIVQIAVEIPPVDRPLLQQWFHEHLTALIAETPEALWSDSELGNVFWDGIERFLQTPRDVKRYSNLLRLSYPPVRTEVNAADFLAIQALQTFVHPVYAAVRGNASRFVGSVVSWRAGMTRLEAGSAGRPEPAETEAGGRGIRRPR
jgi:predicted KAP-like P-loop ATPase